MNFEAIHSPAMKAKTWPKNVMLPHMIAKNGSSIRNIITPAIRLTMVISGKILVIVVTPSVAAILFENYSKYKYNDND